MLHQLAKRTGLPNVIHWHLGRKLVFRTGLELGIPNPIMKLLLGKSVPMSDGTYYAEGINLKPDSDKLHQTIRLFPKTTNGQTKQTIEVIMEVLRAIVEDKMKEHGFGIDVALGEPAPVDWKQLYKKLKQ